MWYKTESLTRPSTTNTNSSRSYNYMRRNIVEKQRVDDITNEVITYFEYEEIKIPKVEWEVFLQAMANAATIDYIAMMADIDI